MLRDDVTSKKRRKLGQNMGHGNGVNDVFSQCCIFRNVYFLQPLF